VVILGGGFGGLGAARALRRAPVDVTLLDRRNFHLFQPLMYQVATGSLSPGEIAAPLRSVLSAQKNVRVLLGEAVDVDPVAQAVILADGARFAYDTLIVATGSETSYYGNDDWKEWAPSIKTLEEATAVRHKNPLCLRSRRARLRSRRDQVLADVYHRRGRPHRIGTCRGTRGNRSRDAAP
jgi:NADH dehydrogenase